MGSRALATSSIGGIRWLIAREHVGDIRALLDRVDQMLERGRLVKEVRVKSLVECNAEIAGRSVTVLAKVYRPARGVARLKELFRRNRAVREMEAAAEAASRGIDVVVPLAAGVGGGRGIVICEKLEGWRSLDVVLRDRSIASADRHRVVTAFGRFARRIHDVGVRQDDFDPNNILVRCRGNEVDLKLIDFERVTFYRSIGWSKRSWALAKMNRIAGVSSADRLRFLHSYLAPDRSDRWKYHAERIAKVGTDVLNRDCRRLAGNCVRENRNFGRFRFAAKHGYYRKLRGGWERSFGLTNDEVAAIVAAGAAPGLTRIDCRDVVDRWKAMNVAERLGVVRREPVDIPVLAVMGNGGDGFILILRAKKLD